MLSEADTCREYVVPLLQAAGWDIMRKLRRVPRAGFPPSRAAVVVPNGTLFGDGVCARIKEELLKEFNLHAIVRLPNSVFAPYTGIPTNLLFFDRKNPSAKDDITHLPPEQLAASILEKEKRIAEIVGNIQKLLNK